MSPLEHVSQSDWYKVDASKIKSGKITMTGKI